jgi:hypothetical protein
MPGRQFQWTQTTSKQLDIIRLLRFHLGIEQQPSESEAPKTHETLDIFALADVFRAIRACPSDRIRQWIFSMILSSIKANEDSTFLMTLIIETIRQLDTDVTSLAQQRAGMGLFEQFHDDALLRLFVCLFFLLVLISKRRKTFLFPFSSV